MSIFGIIKSDDQVYAGDKIQINFDESFLSPALTFALASHEVSFDSGVTWIDVSTNKLIDWIFQTSGTISVQLRLNTTEPASQIFSKQIDVLDLSVANLFSTDADIKKYEPEIDLYLPKKWSSWNMIHKAAQSWIIDWLDEKRIYNQSGEKYSAKDIMDKQQVKQLSSYKALEFIFAGNSSVVGDLFSMKRDKYRELSSEKASRSQLSLDFNKNEIKDEWERTDLFSVTVNRA
jgi:hypothetical protein